MHMRSGICFFITTWLELMQAFSAYWFQHTVCKMESFQIPSSLLKCGPACCSPCSFSLVSEHPPTGPWQSSSREQCPAISLANSWISQADLLVVSNCVNSSDSHTHVHTGALHPAFVFHFLWCLSHKEKTFPHFLNTKQPAWGSPRKSSCRFLFSLSPLIPLAFNQGLTVILSSETLKNKGFQHGYTILINETQPFKNYMVRKTHQAVKELK